VFIILCLLYYYICSMKKGNIKIEQLPIAFGCDNRTNYLVIVETINDEPQHTYLVCLHNFLFYNKYMPYYVINQN
jgi:hypothetical protein